MKAAISGLLLVLATAPHAQTVSRAEAEKRLNVLKQRVNDYWTETAALYDSKNSAITLARAFDQNRAPKAKANHLSAWSGWIYVQYDTNGRFYSHHRGALQDMIWNLRKFPNGVDEKYLKYLEASLPEVEATHRKTLANFAQLADAWTAKAGAEENGLGSDAVQRHRERGDRAKAELNRLANIRVFEFLPFEGPLPEPKGLRIGKLTVNYVGWQVRRSELQGRVAQSRQEVAGIHQKIQEVMAEVRALQSEVDRASAQEQARRQVLVDALEAQDREIPDRMKSPAYRQAEVRLGRIQARQAQILARLDQATPSAKIALVEEHRKLESESAGLRARLERLDGTLGIAAERRRRAEAVRVADDAHVAARKTVAHAISDRRIKGLVLDDLLTQHARATRAYDAAQQEVSFLGDQSPKIDRVRAPRYEAQLWSPETDLQRLQTQISETAGQLRYWEDKRRTYRERLLQKAQDVESKSDRLVRWQRASLAAQFGVEVLFTGGDILIKMKSGPQAALGEAYKKIVENVIWPPSYLDANNLTPPGYDLVDTLEANAPTASKALEKRFYKSAATGPATSALVASYLAGEARSDLAGIAQRMTYQSWLDGEEEFLRAVKRNFEVRPLLEEQAKKLAAAEKKLAEATSFRQAGKAAAKSFVMGAVKDYAKAEAKQAIANLFEGEAFWDYNVAQMEFSASALLLLRSSNYYWQLFDVQQGLTALHREIVRQYDPASGMRINTAGLVTTEEDLLIELSNHGSDPHRFNQLQVDVRFGGIPAQRLDGGRLIFRVPADRLRTLEPRAHSLEIAVKG